jgi:hypothetical protein
VIRSAAWNSQASWTWIDVSGSRLRVDHHGAAGVLVMDRRSLTLATSPCPTAARLLDRARVSRTAARWLPFQPPSSADRRSLVVVRSRGLVQGWTPPPARILVPNRLGDILAP